VRSSFLSGALLLISVFLFPGRPNASSVVVPDEYPSIQAGIDAGADTVLIREGNHDEVPQAYRGVALFGIGGTRPRLAGLMISNPFDGLSKAYDIRDLVFSGPVTIRTVSPRARLLDIAFSRCRLAQGLQHGSTDPNDIDRLVLSNCLIEGFFDARSASFELHSDTATAGVSCTFEGLVSVDSCWFRGGSQTALRLGANDQAFGSVVGNVFEDTPVGMYLTNCYQMSIRSNVVRRASAIGMELEGRYIQLSDNVISNCGVGVLRSFGETTLTNNRITHTANSGAQFFAPELVHADRNIVGHCGNSAIFVEWPSYSDLRFAQNTFYNASGSAILIGEGSDATLTAEGNIGFGMSRFGLEIVPVMKSTTLRCNDWFANALGAVSGVEGSSLDLSVDPGFCDFSNDNVGLYSVSPLLAQPQCLQIGALGAGCSPPSLSLMNLASSRSGLAVAWQFEAASVVECWIERANHVVGPWDSLGIGRMVASNSFELLDGAVAPDRQYQYRVAWRDRGVLKRGHPVSATWTDAGRLSSVSPNPSSGEVTVDWVLARPGASNIRVFDLAGREVSLVAQGFFDVGRHQARWEGRWEGRGVAPAGMYIVRISSGERTTSHRVLLLR